MASAAKQTTITADEYLVRERAAEFKSEFYRGRIRAMSGASLPHNLIAWNLSSELHAQLKGRPCVAFMSDMRIVEQPTGDYYYPDISALGGEPRLLDGEFDTLTNP